MIGSLPGWNLKWALGLIAATCLVAPDPGAIATADELAYSCERDICLINPDNPAQHSNLTETGLADERAPSWSPDGNLIAFVADYFGSYDVLTIDPTKTATEQEATAISETPDRGAEFRPPAWSPDGTKIAFAERVYSNAPPNLESEVYVGPRDGGSDPITIDSTSNKSELTPAWSPDSSTLLFSREGFLWKGPGDGSVKPAILNNSAGYEPDWSPDGARIATVTFSDPEHIRITNADGSGFHELPQAAIEGPVDWSPDSSLVTFVADSEPLKPVWVAPADGSAPGHAVAMPSGWIVPHNPAFSPDGTRVAFDARPESGNMNEQVLVGPADGSAPAVPITKSPENNEGPQWKPCEGCAPPPKPPASSGSGSGAGAPGSVGSGAGASGSKTPTKVRLVYFKQVYALHYMTPVSIDCNAKGGHPNPKYCKGNGIATAVAPSTAFRSWAKPKATAKKVVFAKGSVKVPEGKSKPLKMKITGAGEKLLKAGKSLKIKLVVKVTRPTGKALTFKKTIEVEPQSG
jgi:Tol biopolymer transport system component